MADAARLTISKVNRLGGRIRRKDPIEERDLEMLQMLIFEHAEVLAGVQRDLVAAIPSVSPTARLKTVQTIVDKLRREHRMALSRMQDIAGIRIVEEMDRDQQDILVDDIRRAVGGEITDRRADPRYGYRAVHVIVVRDARSVEIQVRTARQDQWAQIVEKLAETWGRQLRYGGEPNLPDDPVRGSETRATFWELVLELADLVDYHERTALASVPPEEAADSSQVDDLLVRVARLAETL